MRAIALMKQAATAKGSAGGLTGSKSATIGRVTICGVRASTASLSPPTPTRPQNQQDTSSLSWAGERLASSARLPE